MSSKNNSFSKILFLGIPLALYGSSIVYAAQPINLRHQSMNVLHTVAAQGSVTYKETKKHIDSNQTLHVRFQQTYAGYKVWGADGVMHIPHGSKNMQPLKHMPAFGKNNVKMNGTIYQNIQADLANTPARFLSLDQAEKALKTAIESYYHRIGGKPAISNTSHERMVFIDKANKAHWIYKVSFEPAPVKENATPERRIYLIDAQTLGIYQEWNDIKTLDHAQAGGGGFGGNIKMGKLLYDGLKEHLAKLDIERDAAAGKCFLENKDVVVKDHTSKKVMSYNCSNKDDEHNNLYWSGDFDAVNDGYSPGNDALFGGQVIKHMYKDWYDMDVLTKRDGSPMMLKMIVHQRNYDNAYWDGKQMTFGDGYHMFYPLTSLGVAAHEVSHGFTEQHSDLIYHGQSGGLNESFSDMAAQAAELYAYGKNSWQIGPEIFKSKGLALRYMDKPSKDCEGRRPGRWCSIDNAEQYESGLDVHYSSGVYNHFFYDLGSAKDWDAKKAFDVMVHANSDYWTSDVSFKEAACGVLSAAKDLKYSDEAILAAFKVVKIDVSDC